MVSKKKSEGQEADMIARYVRENYIEGLQEIQKQDMHIINKGGRKETKS